MTYRFTVACVLSLTAALSFAAVEAGLFVRDLRYHTLPLVEQNIKIVGGSSTSIEKGLREWRDQSKIQADQATLAARTLNTDLRTFGSLLSTANATLAQLNDSYPSLRDQAGTFLIGASNLVTRTGPVLDGLERTANNAADVSQQLSQSLSRVLPRVESVAASVDATSHDIQSISANIDTESGLLVGATRKALAPQSRRMVLLKALGGNAVTVMEAMYYLRNGG